MNDQATTLRAMASNEIPLNPANSGTTKREYFQLDKKESRLSCLAVTGGKGGVGKSNLSINLALELGAQGKKVTLLDADFGLANADLLCGVTPQFHLGHVIGGIKELEEIAINLAANVRLIPSGSGIEELANFSLTAHSHIFKKLSGMEHDLDYLLIDTAAGIGGNVLGVLSAAAEIIIVVTPEPTSIVDAYATIKTLLKRSPNKPISIVVNNVIGIGDAEQVFHQLSFAVQKFLQRQVEFLGMIPHDSQLLQAVREQMPLVHFAPDAPASRAIRLIAKQLNNREKQGLAFPIQSQSFWNMLAHN